MISPELTAFFDSGVSIQVGTRDERNFPDCVRAVGVRVDASAGELTVFLPIATANASIANLRDNGRIALCFSRPSDHRTYQLKGRAVDVRDANDGERAVVERYCGLLADDLGFLGLPPRLILRLNRWPCAAVRVRAETIFVQTPGPGAGAPLGVAR